MPRAIAIVTDGMWRKSLSAIRALGRAGYEVHVLGDSWSTVGFWSRFTARRVVVPDAKDDAAGFGAALTQHLRTLRAASPGSPKPVLVPMEEDSLRYVAENSDSLRAYADFLVATPEALEQCADKALTAALADGLGMPHPRTEVARSADVMMTAIGRMAGTEFVIKPVNGSGSRGVRYNPSFDAATASSYFSRFGPVLVQQRLPPDGDALGVSVLMGPDGRCLAHFCHKRLHQFPNSGGPSTDRVGITNKPLLEMSMRLFEAVGWRGVAMAEWKVDPRSGQAHLLEINPRFWGSLELAVRSGVNFPVLYARAAAGHYEASPLPVDGIRCRWLIPGDLFRWFTAGKNRESVWNFCAGLPRMAEEWDAQDVRGFLSCIVCQALGALRPKYRNMLRR